MSLRALPLPLLLMFLLIASGPLAARADEAADLYAVPAVQYQRQQWKYAAEGFKTFLEKYPEHPKAGTARFLLGETLIQLGRLEEAAVQFEAYLAHEPAGAYARSALFRTGELAQLAGKAGQAKPLLEQFLAKYPDDKLNSYVLPYLGNLALAAKDTAGAAKFFRQALDRYPEGKLQDDCRMGLAETLAKLDQRDEAERLYRAVASKTGTPLAEDAQFHLAALQYAEGKYDEAMASFDAFETRLTASRWRASARLGHGFALLKLNRPADAVPYFKTITADRNVGLQGRYWLGITQKTLKDYRGAAATLLEAAEVAPDDPLVPAMRFHAADALLLSGQPTEAAEQFDKVLATAPAGHELREAAMRGRLQAALAAKDYATVDRLAAEFAAHYPDSPKGAEVRRFHARSLLAQKQYQAALDVLQPLVEAGASGEDGDETRYLAALAHEGLGDTQDALKMVSKAASSSPGPLRADAQLTQASLLVNLKRYAEAVKPLEAYLAGNSDDDNAAKGLGLLAICLARNGDLAGAQKRYGELLRKYPRHALIATVTEQIAEAAYDAGDLPWAEPLYEWLARDTRPADVQFRGLAGLGWTHYKAGRWEKAAETFQRLLEKNPGPEAAAEAALVRGQALEKLGRNDAALAMYDRVIEQYATSAHAPDALWAAARLRDRLDQDRDAATLYERLVKNYPKFPEREDALYQWAWTLRDQGNDDRAAEVFEQLRDEFPEGRLAADVTFRLAEHAFKKNDPVRAAELAAAVMSAKAPAEIREKTLYLQGQIAAAAGKWDQTREKYEALLKEFPESKSRVLAEYGIAESVFRQNDYEEAARRFERLRQATASQRQPWMAVIPLRLAQSRGLLDQWSKAYEAASSIEKDFPNFADQYEADYILGRALIARSDIEGGREAYRRVIRSPKGEKTETAAKAQFMLAESFMLQKDYATALGEYTKVEVLYGYPKWQALALCQAGVCHEKLGEWNEAFAAFERVVQQYPQEKEMAGRAAHRLEALKSRTAGK